MKLNLKKILPTDYRIIPVPSERIKGEAKQLETIEVDSGEVFKVVDCFTYELGEIYPSALALLGFGKHIPVETIWERFQKSERMYFFVCILV